MRQPLSKDLTIDQESIIPVLAVSQFFERQLIMKKRAVLITGSSSGIGRALVEYFSAKDYQVFAGVRNSTDGERLRSEVSESIRPVILDITKATDIELAIAKIGKSLDVLVNNAGITYGGPIESLNMAEVRALFEVNVFGQIALIQKAVPLLRQSQGYIINVSSIAGSIAQPFISPYCASKFAFEAFSIGLRTELKPFGVKVAIVAPAGIDTVLWDKSRDLLHKIKATLSPALAELYKKPLDGFAAALEKEQKKAISVNEVVKTLEKILRTKNPKIHYFVGPHAVVGSLAKRLLPEKFLYSIAEKRFGVD
jgi:short-subunit dehydrogenase